MRRRSFAWIIVAAVVGMILFTAYNILFSNNAPKTEVVINKKPFTASVFYTTSMQENALNSTSWPLGDNFVGLLVYDELDKWPAWMASNAAPRDFVWLDDKKRVIDIVQKALPDNEPHRKYTPRYRVKYLLVMAGGAVSMNSINAGDIVTFSLDNIKALAS